MSAIKYSPYIPNIDAWVDYFKNQPVEYKKFYTIGRAKHKGEDMNSIKLVTPTEQVVQQAKSELKREMDDSDAEEHVLKRRKKSSKKVITKSSDKYRKKK